MRAELRWRRARRRAAARKAGVVRSLAGPRIVISSPPSDSSRSWRLSATVGKRVPPLTLFTTRSTGRNPEERAERRATSAPSRATAAVDAQSVFPSPSGAVSGLRRVRSRCRSRDFAASIRPPTLFRRPLPKKRWLDGRYRGLITRGRSRRASLDDFCNPCDPQARSARSVDTLFPPRETEVPCGEEQVRALCGASQPRPFGRGSVVSRYVTGCRRCFRRDCSCAEGLPLPDWARTPLSKGSGSSRRGAVAGA